MAGGVCVCLRRFTYKRRKHPLIHGVGGALSSGLFTHPGNLRGSGMAPILSHLRSSRPENSMFAPMVYAFSVYAFSVFVCVLPKNKRRPRRRASRAGGLSPIGSRSDRSLGCRTSSFSAEFSDSSLKTSSGRDSTMIPNQKQDKAYISARQWVVRRERKKQAISGH